MFESNKNTSRPPQHQDRQPGFEYEMVPSPEHKPPYPGSGKLSGKVAVITGGDSGIGRAVAEAYAVEGAIGVVIVYFDEDKDAQDTQVLVKNSGSDCLLIKGDVADPKFCESIVERSLDKFRKIDILVNNAAQHYPQPDLLSISYEQVKKIFAINVFSYFYLTKAALRYLNKGASIINTTSITAYKGDAELIDYAASKGAIVSFTRSLSQSLMKQGIRVNGVAPGPIWTPLIPASFPAEKVQQFGSQYRAAPMGRAGEPNEVAPCYVFLASQESSYISGQVLHPNGGEVING